MHTSFQCNKKLLHSIVLCCDVLYFFGVCFPRSMQYGPVFERGRRDAIIIVTHRRWPLGKSSFIHSGKQHTVLYCTTARAAAYSFFLRTNIEQSVTVDGGPGEPPPPPSSFARQQGLLSSARSVSVLVLQGRKCGRKLGRRGPGRRRRSCCRSAQGQAPLADPVAHDRDVLLELAGVRWHLKPRLERRRQPSHGVLRGFGKHRPKEMHHRGVDYLFPALLNRSGFEWFRF